MPTGRRLRAANLSRSGFRIRSSRCRQGSRPVVPLRRFRCSRLAVRGRCSFDVGPWRQAGCQFSCSAQIIQASTSASSHLRGLLPSRGAGSSSANQRDSSQRRLTERFDVESNSASCAAVILGSSSGMKGHCAQRLRRCTRESNSASAQGTQGRCRQRSHSGAPSPGPFGGSSTVTSARGAPSALHSRLANSDTTRSVRGRPSDQSASSALSNCSVGM